MARQGFRDTIYNIPGSGAGFDLVLASSPPAGVAGTNIPVTLGFARRFDIEETFAAAGTPNPQGLQYQIWDPSTKTWGPTVQLGPGEPIYLGDPVGEGHGSGPVLGLPAQTTFFPDARGTTSRAADVPIRILSGTVTGTLIRVRESQ
jgi:hypothetical protein